MHSTAQARGKARPRWPAAGFGRGEAKDRPEPFAAGEKAVAHGSVDGRWPGLLLREKAIQGAINFFLSRRKISLQFHRSGTLERSRGHGNGKQPSHSTCFTRVIVVT